MIEIVRLLLARGAKLDVVDGENITPYELMCCGGLASPDNIEDIRQAMRDAGAADNVFTHIYLGQDEDAIKTIKANPALAHAQGPNWFTPLQTAARAARPAVVKMLLENGIAADSPKGTKNTPLWFVCQSDADAKDRLEIATILLGAGANPRRECEDQSTPLHYAAWRGPIEMVELLLRHNAKEWQADRNGKKPVDYAREGVAPDKGRIVELLDRPVIRDPHFRQAVKAIHAGDLETLRKLLAIHPNLVHDRAIEPDCYQPGYFKDPKLLWFVADNPNLIEMMPRNSVEIAAAMIDAGAEMPDLDYTLGLVMTSLPARAQNLQRPLMKLLLDRGATADHKVLMSALGHRETDAVLALLDAGLPMTAPIAAALGRVAELDELLKTADADTLHAAFSVAVINRQVNTARLCLNAGADPNVFLSIHTHSTAAHQAVIHDHVEMLQLLVAHGVKLDIRDTLWNSTPLGWAIHEKRSAAEAYLRSSGAA